MIAGLMIFVAWLLFASGAFLVGYAMAQDKLHHKLVLKNYVTGEMHVLQLNIVFVGLGSLMCGLIVNAWLWPGF